MFMGPSLLGEKSSLCLWSYHSRVKSRHYVYRAIIFRQEARIMVLHLALYE